MLGQLFARISTTNFSEDGKYLEVKGWSILQEVKENKLIINEQEISISFTGEEIGELNIVSIKNPWFILSDIELSQDELESINAKLIELSGLMSEENNAGDDGSPHTSPPVIVNEYYESGKVGFFKRGFVEYVGGNFRLLILKTETVFQANLIELINENKITQLQNPVTVVDGFYKFKDDKNNRIVNAKIIDNELDISFDEIEVETNSDLEEDKNEIEI